MREIAINGTYTIRCVESKGIAYEDCEKCVFNADTHLCKQMLCSKHQRHDGKNVHFELEIV